MENIERQKAALAEIATTDLLDVLRFVANECQKSPTDSVRDILNEAFDDYGLALYAEWSDDSDNPIFIRI